MRIIKHYSLVAASKVLAEVTKHIKRTKGEALNCDCWSNGREQGYHLANYDLKKAVVFGVQRRSDFIVVYYGMGTDFDVTTNQPHDWNNFIQFESGNTSQIVDAAVWITKYLTKKDWPPKRNCK